MTLKAGDTIIVTGYAKDQDRGTAVYCKGLTVVVYDVYNDFVLFYLDDKTFLSVHKLNCQLVV